MNLIDEYGKILKFNRRTARDTAFKILFIHHITGADAEEAMEIFGETSFKEEDMKYIKAASAGAIENLSEIDAIIENNSRGWKKSRISSVCISALRLAIYEILFMPDIPVSVSINEAVEIIKTYDEPKTAFFANGILGKLEKTDVSGD
ncbi:MAG: transcription antitermination factor NusB [Clostridia bacterium]|nr:transcription antitermination factor NusB [Clostridia bacterium]